MPPEASSGRLPPSALPTADDYTALVQEVQSGDRRAMERLLLETHDAARRFSLLVCGRSAPDAEDAVQEALIKTYRYARRIREPGAFRAWLYRTVRNACLLSRRRRAREPVRLVSLDQGTASGRKREGALDPPDPGRRPDELVIQERLRARLGDALADLPARYRTVVVLRDLEGLTGRETAAVLGISEENVRARLHRARVLLRDRLRDL